MPTTTAPRFGLRGYGQRFSVWASHSLQKAEVRSAFTAAGVSLAGKEVFSTPRHISNLGAEYVGSDAWRASLQARAQDDYLIDSPNAKGKYGGFVLLDASTRIKLSKQVSIDVQIKNIADQNYEYVRYENFFWPANNPQPMYSAGPGRAVYASSNATF